MTKTQEAYSAVFVPIGSSREQVMQPNLGYATWLKPPLSPNQVCFFVPGTPLCSYSGCQISPNNSSDSVQRVNMPRELRKRTTKLNYAALLADEDDDEPGPSTRRTVVGEEPDSGSDFAPEIVVVEEENDEEDELSELSEMEEAEDAETHEEPRINKRSQTKRPAKKARVSLALTESASIPNLQHRHRAIPVYQRKGSVERLVNRPQLFQPVETAPTTAWADNSIVQTRIGKALGFNCGSGPVWELLEDRGWFSESAAVDSEAESARRPRVHTSVPMTHTWKIMSAA